MNGRVEVSFQRRAAASKGVLRGSVSVRLDQALPTQGPRPLHLRKSDKNADPPLRGGRVRTTVPDRVNQAVTSVTARSRFGQVTRTGSRDRRHAATGAADTCTPGSSYGSTCDSDTRNRAVRARGRTLPWGLFGGRV